MAANSVHGTTQGSHTDTVPMGRHRSHRTPHTYNNNIEIDVIMQPDIMDSDNSDHLESKYCITLLIKEVYKNITCFWVQAVHSIKSSQAVSTAYHIDTRIEDSQAKL